MIGFSTVSYAACWSSSDVAMAIRRAATGRAPTAISVPTTLSFISRQSIVSPGIPLCQSSWCWYRLVGSSHITSILGDLADYVAKLMETPQQQTTPKPLGYTRCSNPADAHVEEGL